MIKVSLEQINRSLPVLTSLMEHKQIPVKTAYWLNRICSKMSSIIKDYNKAQFELVKSLSDGKIDKGGAYNVTLENREKYSEEIQKLLDEEEELDFNKIKVSDLKLEIIEPKYLIDWLFDEE